MQKTLFTLVGLLLCLITFNACKEDNPPLPDTVIYIDSDTLNIASNQSSIDIPIHLQQAVSKERKILIEINPSKVTYGNEFITEPEVTDNKIHLTIPAGETSASIVLKKNSNAVLNGDETINFQVIETPDPIVLGTKAKVHLKFDAITSTSGTLVGLGKTTESAYTNSVFFDLSGGTVLATPRNSWNLGFLNAAGNRVILNHALKTIVIPTDKNVLADVSESDASGINFNFPLGGGSLSMVDDWTGDLTNTAIAEVKPVAADNKVYIIGFENNTAIDKLYKIRITQASRGYKLDYALLKETQFKTIDVGKTAVYNYNFIAFENRNLVLVQPRASHWDLQWSYSTYNSGTNTPYWFEDVILINSVGGVEASEVLISNTVTYENFGKEQLASVTFTKDQDVIGTKWRDLSGPSIGIKKDRFYLIKDTTGKIYKIKFVKMGLGNDGGERGKPEITYQLIQ